MATLLQGAASAWRKRRITFAANRFGRSTIVAGFPFQEPRSVSRHSQSEPAATPAGIDPDAARAPRDW